MVNTGTGTIMYSSAGEVEELPQLIQKLKNLGFDEIRYGSYRTAAKLRYVQKESNLDLFDIWNIIEAFRDNGLNALDKDAVITLPKLEATLVSLYVNLNKRRPQGQLVDVSSSVRYVLSWMVLAYDTDNNARIRVFSVKVALVTFCNAKLVDKLRYIFTQVSDQSGVLILSSFKDYLKEALALPAMVLEAPTFAYTDELVSTIFNGTSRILINEFLETLTRDPGPLCLVWLLLIDVIATAENVCHPVCCNVCGSPSIQGLRYKCQKCSKFNMCQNCFWRGRTSQNHRNEHEVKEYFANKQSGSAGGFRNSFRKSFKCVPKSRKISKFQDQPERPLNLSYIVPSSPLPIFDGMTMSEINYPDAYAKQRHLMDLGYGPSNPSNKSTSSCAESLSESDDEHRLIARYTARLASESKYSPAFTYEPIMQKRPRSQASLNLFDNTQTQRDMIAQLEARNREILREIARLRYQQELQCASAGSGDTVIINELVTLRYYESDLEEKLSRLKESRNHLMAEIEALMNLLQQQPAPIGHQNIALSGNGMASLDGVRDKHRSAPATPQHHHQSTSVGVELRSAYSIGEENFCSIPNEIPSGVPYNRKNLLIAADSVTHAMSSLVRELNAREKVEESANGIQYSVGTGWDREVALKQLAEEEKYLEQLRNMRLSEGDSDTGFVEQVEELLFSRTENDSTEQDGDCFLEEPECEPAEDLKTCYANWTKA